jgi:hypothetical protein
VLTCDGCQEVVRPVETKCCPPPLCGNDLCCTFVAFMQLLPSGPLWDYWKEAAISYFQHSDDPSLCPLLTDPACPSLVLHSIYTVLKLKAVVHDALWPAFRESNPVTAITTLDDHLLRLKWEDCYAQHCRSVLLGEITPYEIMTECGPLFVPVTFPANLECALKRNVAIALTRVNMGVIKNVCGINWVVEPLGAEIKPIMPQLPNPDPPREAYCASLCPEGVAFEICPTRDWIEGCPSGDVCDTLRPPPQVPAYYDRDCLSSLPAGTAERIWPAILAAECIVRSMMPTTCPSNITRCC